jgi:hypothetical protein
LLLLIEAADEHGAVPADHERKSDCHRDPYPGRGEQLQRHHRMRDPALDDYEPDQARRRDHQRGDHQRCAEAVRAARDEPECQTGQREHAEDLAGPVERRGLGR